jgi:hypothetical protein
VDLVTGKGPGHEDAAYERELARLRAQNIAQAARIIALEQALARCARLGIRLREVLTYYDEGRE